MFVKTTWFDHSRASQSAEPARVALQSIYNVRADLSYDIRPAWSGGQFALIRTLRGRGEIHVARRPEFVVRENSLLLVMWNQIERYFCSDSHWDFWWFDFTVVSQLPLPLNEVLQIPYTKREDAEISRCFEWLRQSGPGSSALASSVLSGLLHYWALEFPAAASTQGGHREAVNKVIEAMNANLSARIVSTAPLKVSEMADIASLSARRFRDVFQACTGKTPKQFYDQLRLDISVDYLRFNAMTVSEVADQLGYSSPFHFSKAFRKQFGVPPSQYLEETAKASHG